MRLRTFEGGIYLLGRKEATQNKPIEDIPLPPEVVIPLHQHVGPPCDPLVQKGDRVLVGQKIGDTDTFISAPIHASVSGEVKAVEPHPHFTGTEVLSVVVVPDGEQEEVRLEVPDQDKLTPDRVRSIVREAGIVGLSGTVFPTHVKLSPPKESPIESVIINGCECEPYLTGDYRSMLESTESLIVGLKIILMTVGAKKGYFGIGVDKAEAIKRIEDLTAREQNIEVVPLDTKYPQGSERHLIKAILGREVPRDGVPMDLGVLVQNVATTIAITQAVREGKPLVERVLTVTGPGIKNPKNLRVKIGTLVKYLIEQCGGFEGEPGKIIFGGVMRGEAQFSLDVPVVKGSQGIVVLPKEMAEVSSPRPCVRCGRCVKVCPMSLIPIFIVTYVMEDKIDEANAAGVLECVECGACGLICPTEIPFIQYIRFAKNILLKERKT
ncbi:MAG: electron transport complex subunit RsxC [Actinomycetota bacterium]